MRGTSRAGSRHGSPYNVRHMRYITPFRATAITVSIFLTVALGCPVIIGLLWPNTKIVAACKTQGAKDVLIPLAVSYSSWSHIDSKYFYGRTSVCVPLAESFAHGKFYLFRESSDGVTSVSSEKISVSFFYAYALCLFGAITYLSVSCAKVIKPCLTSR